MHRISKVNYSDINTNELESQVGKLILDEKFPFEMGVELMNR